ncbi:uncharacterized protein LOC128282025 [Gossypium arboreum]|uniref:uncharacterized protein LOC128282025 n=1 Tax=Gossypium arboreum TaxID=29729 RepID=UPI0022F1B464|nr:uncharacterized protein LOC128282025 [Gossypium arboreum]
MPNVEAREALDLLVIETRSHDRVAGDDALSQAMLQILERVARPNTSTVGRGSVTERIKSNGAKIFRGITGVAPNAVEYWIEATERIMDDLNCTSEQKLKGAVSLLRDKAYQWWLIVKEGTQPDRLTLEFFENKGVSEFDPGGKSVAKYEAEFLRLSRSVRGMVTTEYECCVHFEVNLRDDLQVLIAPQREQDFTVLVEKVKIAEDVKCVER